MITNCNIPGISTTMDQEDRPWTSSSLEDFVSKLSPCKDCCNGGYMSYHCPLCPTSKFKPTKHYKVVRHLGVHWKTRIDSEIDGLMSVICYIRHDNFYNDRGHYHCPHCSYINVKRKRMLTHIQNCPVLREHRGDNSDKSEKTSRTHDACDNITIPRITKYKSTSKREVCNICGKRIHKRWLKCHKKLHGTKKDITENRHNWTVIVDSRNGIYASAKNLNGPQHPVHAVKRLHGDMQVECEGTDCMDTLLTASRGCNLAYECDHIRSIQYAVPGKRCDMKDAVLTQMVDEGYITSERKEQALDLKRNAESKTVPFVVLLPTEEGTSERQIYLSVYTGVSSHWGRFQRTIVTFDTRKKVTYCRCSNSRVFCVHKIVGKWYIAQNHPVYFSSVNEESNDAESHLSEPASEPAEDTEDLSHIRTDTDPGACLSINREVDYHFINTQELRLAPQEENCLKCNGSLVESVINQRAKIVTMRKVIRGITVVKKRCTGCGMEFKFRGYSKGLHSADGSLFLGIDVCLFLRSGLQNHVAIGRSVAVLEDMLSEHIACNEIQRVYLHFEAACGHDYNFTCILCGFHPVVVIWDTFRKAGFRFAVSDLRIPEHFNDTVNAKRFWNDVENAVLSGTPTTAAEPPISPSYSNWAPWIGENTRLSDEVYNTEVKKCVKNDDTADIDEPMPEELLTSLLLNEKVTNIRRICRSMGLRGEGSAMDMILKMRERSITKGTFDRAYEKVFGCTGGWAVGCCPHGIIYCIKNLLRSESPRDYLDLERSFKHRPNISICDIAHLLARHGNNVIPGFYQPNEGRLAEISEENLSCIEAGNASFSLPFLNSIHNYNEGISLDQNTNPITRSSHHLSLFDWFHEKNCKSRKEILRRSSLLKELPGIINTQVVEQVFSSAKRDIYYLNNMSPTNHLFVFRLSAHLRNEKKNKAIRERQRKQFGENIRFNQFGQLTQLYAQEESIDIDFEESAATNQQSIQENTDNNHSENLNVPLQTTPVKERVISVFNNAANMLLQTSEIEQNNFHRNMQYVNGVIGKTAPECRRREVKKLETHLGLFQTQGESNYCGLCAINNAVWNITQDQNHFTIEELDHEADLIWTEMSENPSLGPFAPLETMRDREGFYSLEVLAKVVRERNVSIVRMQPSLFASMTFEEAGKTILDHSLFLRSPISVLVRKSTAQHWVTLCCSNNTFTYMDSQCQAPRSITISETGQLLKMHEQNGALYLLTNNRQSGDEVRANVHICEGLQCDTSNNERCLYGPPSVEMRRDSANDDPPTSFRIETKSDGAQEKAYNFRENPKKVFNSTM